MPSRIATLSWRWSGTAASRSSATSRLSTRPRAPASRELVLEAVIGLDLMDRTDRCQPVAHERDIAYTAQRAARRRAAPARRTGLRPGPHDLERHGRPPPGRDRALR